LSKAAILIVDDDEDILYFFKVLLEENGYKVDTARTGQEALDKAETNGYDLILLDYRLSDAFGGVIADELTKIDESVQIIYITGYSMKGEVPRSDLVREVLIKPIPENVLLKAVREAAADKVRSEA
jgi:two-component system phosphate regulon sensor histidine kinase PhoR